MARALFIILDFFWHISLYRVLLYYVKISIISNNGLYKNM